MVPNVCVRFGPQNFCNVLTASVNSTNIPPLISSLVYSSHIGAFGILGTKVPHHRSHCLTTKNTAIIFYAITCGSLHQLHQLTVVVHYVIFHLVGGDFGEEFSGAFDLGFFDLAQVH